VPPARPSGAAGDLLDRHRDHHRDGLGREPHPPRDPEPGLVHISVLRSVRRYIRAVGRTSRLAPARRLDHVCHVHPHDDHVRDSVASASMVVGTWRNMNFDEEDPKELAANRHLVLLSDDEGYALWEVDTDLEEPLATFPATVEGSEAAWDAFGRATWRIRAGRLLNAMMWTAGILGLVWAGTTMLEYVLFAL